MENKTDKTMETETKVKDEKVKKSKYPTDKVEKGEKPKKSKDAPEKAKKDETFADTVFNGSESEVWTAAKEKTEQLRGWLDTKTGHFWSGFITGTINGIVLWSIKTWLPKFRDKSKSKKYWE